MMMKTQMMKITTQGTVYPPMTRFANMRVWVGRGGLRADVLATAPFFELEVVAPLYRQPGAPTPSRQRMESIPPTTTLGAADEKTPEAATSPALRPYSVGGPVDRQVRRLHLNEYRFAHPPAVIEALRSALDTSRVDDLLTNYQSGPDPVLAEDLARYVGAPSARNILVAAGSDEILRAILDTCPLRGQRALLMGVPGYTHFEHYARLKCLEIVAYPIGLGTSAADHEASLRYYADLLVAGCLVYLCSPNNPTGDMWGRDTVAALAAEFPRSLFLVDEAYIEFASVAGNLSDPVDVDVDDSSPLELHAAALNARSLAAVALAHENVVVTRTFSKAFGLAALRIGYAVGAEKTIELLGIAVSPKAFNPIAAPVAHAALHCLAHYRRTTLAARREAQIAVKSLCVAGWWALDTPGNFYLVYVGDAAGVTAALGGLGVQVRNRDDLPGLAGFVRLTAGTPADTIAVIQAFARLTPPTAKPPQALYTPKGVVAAVKALTKRVLCLLRTADVQVWAQGGTLLGMLRHQTPLVPGGMIPTDDDVDLAYVRANSKDPLEPLVSFFAGAGLTLQRNRTGAYWQVGTNKVGGEISPVHIDIFSYSLVNTFPYNLVGMGWGAQYVLDDVRFQEEDPSSPQAHCNTKYALDELFPLSTAYRFYDLVIPVPAKAEAALRRALGADCMQIMRSRTPSGLVEITLKDFSPA
jgi:histidinol-phosphate aminotransferase